MFPWALQPCLPRRIAGAATLAAALAMPWAAWGQGGSGSGTSAASAPSLVTDQQPQYWFGVAVESIPPVYAKLITPKLQPGQGFIVVTVFDESPAKKAGIKPGDLLIELNGKPLTSQEDLAQAAYIANPTPIGATKAPQTLMQKSVVLYQREDRRYPATLTPELRPSNMLATGAAPVHFPPGNAADVQGPQFRTMVTPQGNHLQYGPAYQVDTNSQKNLILLQNALGNGQSIIITQQTDEAGNTSRSIREGDKTYAVEAGKLDQIPENLRPLALKLISQSQTTPAPAPVSVSNQPITLTTAQRLEILEKQNAELQRKIDLLLQAMQPPQIAPINGTPQVIPAPAAIPAQAPAPAANATPALDASQGK